jgi:hypothetical protein
LGKKDSLGKRQYKCTCVYDLCGKINHEMVWISRPRLFSRKTQFFIYFVTTKKLRCFSLYFISRKTGSYFLIESEFVLGTFWYELVIFWKLFPAYPI